MNEKGQFLLYDGVLAIIILFIIMIVCFNILEKESTVYDITALFHMDEIVNNLAKLKIKDPSQKVRQILDL